MNELLGERIRDLRSAKHLTQEQMAEGIGVSRQKYARIENGTNQITLDVLTRIAGLLDVTVGDITRVLDESPAVAYRTGSGSASSEMILDMLDLFYANKHLYGKLQQKAELLQDSKETVCITAEGKR
ncbi:MAG: helix-turn-helix transcriptional regulator [Lachnospiraceae bacterium]|jgi:transcriptional regulator with XRE-family HTH domain|nr:helix-turn-helix transcriptional regulator [Lachnospiraceae bacterium]